MEVGEPKPLFETKLKYILDSKEQQFDTVYTRTNYISLLEEVRQARKSKSENNPKKTKVQESAFYFLWS